jgi:hypothetical protein
MGELGTAARVFSWVGAVVLAVGCSSGASTGEGPKDGSTSGDGSHPGLDSGTQGMQEENESDGGEGDAEGGASGPVYPLTLTPLTNALTQTANITLFFSVSDATGNGVTGLSCNSSTTGSSDAATACDFLYYEDGQPLDPTESAFDVQPVPNNALKMPTVLVLQTSPSIIENGELTTLKAAAETIIQNMLPQQTMELITFADQLTPNVRVPFTNNQTTLINAVEAIDTPDGTSTNLYGTLDYALGQWTDGFSASGAAGELTAGLLIVITNGSDNAARQTLSSVVQARGNKRVIAIGVGTGTTLDTCALDVIGNELVMIRPTYAALSMDIGQVTSHVQALGQSIYIASYCSPKREAATGSSDHQLTFTVAGNAQYNSATCQNAVFTTAQANECSGAALPEGGVTPAQSCAPGSSGTVSDSPALDNTQACGASGLGAVACCPANLPYDCPLTHTCYGTAGEAAIACGASCVLCGGTGTASQNDELVPGTEIVVPFDSATYASGQCPALWGPNCKGFETCCGGITNATLGLECANALIADVGNETSCASEMGTYCATGSCQTLESCCNALPGPDAGTSVQSTCYSQLVSAAGSSTACAAVTPTYGSYNPTACPLGLNCQKLSTCCAALPGADAGSSTQATCESDLTSAAGNETTCATDTPRFNSYNATACPLGPSCTALTSCCGALTGTAATTCTGDLTSAAGNEASCAVYTPRFNSYNAASCPLGPECTGLAACCTTVTSTYTATCNTYVSDAAGNESSCESYIEDLYADGCTGPMCASLKTCCASLPAGSSIQTSCNSYLSDSEGYETDCSDYAPRFCPTGPNCSSLKTCCSTFAGTGQATCYSDLQDADGSESYCSDYQPTFCPTGPNCSQLKTCCESLTGSALNSCESAFIDAGGSETSCASALTSQNCP